jgi:hypothetical protein
LEAILDINRLQLICFFILVALFLSACATNQSTYFRKHQATLADERKDWGLCGGDFFPSGALKPEISEEVLHCMRGKGYETLNDYYVEEHVGFVRNDNPEDFRLEPGVLRTCGVRWPEKGLCSYQGYIPKRILQDFVKCMSSYGYQVALPRWKLGIPVVDDRRDFDPLFCMYLTPRNSKGGVSLGNRRVE